MLLPAGLWQQGRLRRDFCFKPVTGEAEMALADCALTDVPAPSIPARVTAALVATLASVGGQEPGRDLVRCLPVADRQFLMRRLAINLGLDHLWLTPNCPQCAVAFDVEVTLSKMPIKPAGRGFPFAVVQTSQGTLRLRAPNGRDQESIANLDDETTAQRRIVGRCIDGCLEGNEPVDGVELRDDDRPAIDPDTFSEEDLSAIESALESMCPELAVSVRTDCPECGTSMDVPVDAYLILRRDHSEIYSDVHALASAYHWSEPQILALSRSRRKRYLSMVNCQRGLVE